MAHLDNVFKTCELVRVTLPKINEIEKGTFLKKGWHFFDNQNFWFLEDFEKGKGTPHNFQPHCTPCYNRTFPGHSLICFLEKPRQVGTNYRLSVRKDPGRDAMKTSKTEISRGTTFLNQPAWFELTWVQDRDDTQ